MFVISIPAIRVQPTKLVNKSDGTFVDEQLVKLTHPDMWTELPCSILLSNGRAPYDVGTYELHPDSFKAAQYGRIDFRPVIGRKLDASGVAIPAKQAKAA